jgi:hypothetical protein
MKIFNIDKPNSYPYVFGITVFDPVSGAPTPSTTTTPPPELTWSTITFTWSNIPYTWSEA